MTRALDDGMRAASSAAFGDAEITDVAPLAGGRSGASVLAFTCNGERFVIRKGEPRAVECLRIASELGVAPRLRYAHGGIAIMEHVAGAPFGGCRDRTVIARVATALRRVHDGPAFPESITTNAFFWDLDEMYRARTGARFPERIRALWTECTDACARFPLAPCHRDLNPGNVLVTPERVVILDWDTAAAADPFLDLALLGVFGVPVPDDRAFLLEAYLGHAPSELEAARFVVARVHALVFYAVSFHWLAAISGKVRPAEPVPLGTIGGHIDDPIVVGVSLLAAAEEAYAQPSFATAARSCAG